MKRTSSLLFAAAMVAVACGNSVKEYPTKRIDRPVAIIEELSDSSFLHNLQQIAVFDSKIYIAECHNQRARILRLDSLFNVDLSFGNKGRGPGEFLWLSHLAVEDDTIYALDVSSPKMNLYNLNGKFIKTITFPKEEAYMSGRFLIDGHKQFCYNYDGINPPFRLWNPYNNSEPMQKFGENIPKCKALNIDDERYTLAKKDNNSFFAVGRISPMAIELDYSGRLLNYIDFSDSHYFEPFLIKAKECTKPEDGHQVFFDDACVANDKLYLLTVLYDEDKDTIDNVLFVVNIKNGKMEMENFIVLGAAKSIWFSKFTVCGNKIIAFDGISDGLYIYDMNQVVDIQNND